VSGPASGPLEHVPAVGQPSLGVAAAARRLGVAPATLRTWDRRYGLGPTEHTSGRHRRYAPPDIVRLELMRSALLRGATAADAAGYALAGAPLATGSDRPSQAPGVRASAGRPGRVDVASDAAGRDERFRVDSGCCGGPAAPLRVGGRVLRMPGVGWRARGLGRVALALDAGAACAVLAESIAAIGVQASWDEVARPVLSAVGQRWAESGAGIEIEHLLSECVVRVFGAVAAAAPTDRRPVLLAGAPGEQHTLPMVVLAAALAQRGVACRSLGPDLPVEALVSAVRRIAPAAVVLWAQLAPAADPAVLRALPRTRPLVRVFVAGPGWSGVELPPRVVRLDSLGEATNRISADLTVSAAST
jgi:MerR family transcriptional regulator, light-induced transcriptional regulator